jgi:hypothetical protein
MLRNKGLARRKPVVYKPDAYCLELIFVCLHYPIRKGRSSRRTGVPGRGGEDAEWSSSASELRSNQNIKTGGQECPPYTVLAVLAYL